LEAVAAETARLSERDNGRRKSIVWWAALGDRAGAEGDDGRADGV